MNDRPSKDPGATEGAREAAEVAETLRDRHEGFREQVTQRQRAVLERQEKTLAVLEERIRNSSPEKK
jgi:hypothetical protein